MSIADPNSRSAALHAATSPAADSPLAAPVMEVFASIQGEGAFVGEPQVFLRMLGCPLRCRWCDTPRSWTIPRDARARIAAVRGTRHESAWATPFQALCWIAETEPGAPRTISVTGGEPLLWTQFLLGLKPLCGPRRLHLETGGAHPARLARVIGAFDHISLDLKPELDLDAPVEIETPLRASPALAIDGERSPRTSAEWKVAREACLTLVAGRDACGKIVVSGERTVEELAPLLDEVERCAESLPLYLQPATPLGGSSAPDPRTLTILCEMARDRDLQVRVLPQVHRILRMP